MAFSSSIYTFGDIEEGHNPPTTGSYIDLVVSTDMREAISKLVAENKIKSLEAIYDRKTTIGNWLKYADELCAKIGFVPGESIRFVTKDRYEHAMSCFNDLREQGYNVAILTEKGSLVALSAGFHEAGITSVFLDNYYAANRESAKR